MIDGRHAPRDAGTIRIERVIAAAPERVYRALTDPWQLRDWWHMDGGDAQWTMDLRAGAHWRASGPDAGRGACTVLGETVHAEPPRSFACAWRETRSAPEAARESSVRYDVEPSRAGAMVRITETGADPARMPDRRAQWDRVAAALARFVEEEAQPKR